MEQQYDKISQTVHGTDSHGRSLVTVPGEEDGHSDGRGFRQHRTVCLVAVTFGLCIAAYTRLGRGPPTQLGLRTRALQLQDGLATISDAEGSLCQARLHFLFMAIDDVPHADIWQRFFADAVPCAPKIWLHCKDAEACRRNKFVQKLPRTSIVPTVPSSYCTDLVTPEEQLVRLALQTSGPADKFIIISDSSLPLKPFRVIYQELTRSGMSDLCVYPLCPMGFCRNQTWQSWFWAKGLVTKSAKSVSLPITSQFAVLNRRDARKFVEAWGPAGTRPRSNITSKWFADDLVREEPVWSMDILGESGSTVGRAQFDEVTGWATCADESILFTTLHGAVELQENASMEVPGFGMLSGDHQFWEAPQGSCRTYFSFWMWSLDDRKLETELAQDDGSVVHIGKPESGSHPLSFGTLSPKAMRMLADSEWLFARKFEASANLSGFSDIVFHEVVHE
mmetsp:Transcript_79133/g.256575  ORF Transcript_79133/g.256575 Transcript_79133/m.256575 type:complete len:450 (-) Transcript_79133:291-1640(-)|eukprot:CAMPEP_0203869606 /NCGR_PEP_ID=MMETSP0359-20131031/17802_1 /ASSEMBLY_ACC=CAM_ASM_000338 /TAXON_ID=268821 /ORGANISM="Scrippsiella Hangoei, Strain SHTV-5" /LENGTH=449 /DNA_ID=CAMNT_0050788243 /DNA_START=81 /DNA_END=1430 /DNA_ORIENTATION=+